jgi:uncharacterized SAM-binding protein YcdF (DUF218 family)
VYRFIVQLVQPYTFALILLGLMLVVVRRRDGGKRRARAVALACYTLLMLLSLSPVSHLAVGSLEWQYEPLTEPPGDVRAIVVLGGGSASLPRCERAAALYRPEVHRLVVTSGGYGRADGPVEAEQMRAWLVRMGVAPSAVLVEGEGLSTHENAVRCAALLRERGVTRVLLVTDAVHMPRAAACFRKQGIDVVPAPCERLARSAEWQRPEYHLPKAGSAAHCEYALREWLGLLWYWLRGRV